MLLATSPKTQCIVQTPHIDGERSDSGRTQACPTVIETGTSRRYKIPMNRKSIRKPDQMDTERSGFPDNKKPRKTHRFQYSFSRLQAVTPRLKPCRKQRNAPKINNRGANAPQSPCELQTREFADAQILVVEPMKNVGQGPPLRDDYVMKHKKVIESPPHPPHRRHQTGLPQLH
jgi:hypothetical protein